MEYLVARLKEAGGTSGLQLRSPRWDDIVMAGLRLDAGCAVAQFLFDGRNALNYLSCRNAAFSTRAAGTGRRRGGRLGA